MVKQSKPTRLWFLARGFKKADPRHTGGQIVWLNPETNDVLSAHGTKLALTMVPKEKHLKKATKYLKMPKTYGNMLLARLKYLTFVGPIPKGCVIDHIDGNSLNNSPRNLRAIPRPINDRDGGFLRKLRNKGIFVAEYQTTIILEGYRRMAHWREVHTYYAYRHLDRDTLLQIFLGKEVQQ